eukprot:GHVU01026221.1.p1 GENE.GHVU01026221.1~~GHVU01026221.1.p1  ORF type:complete len:165 (-),score=12.79 GHVU01026221.1:152-646(-)
MRCPQINSSLLVGTLHLKEINDIHTSCMDSSHQPTTTRRSQGCRTTMLDWRLRCTSIHLRLEYNTFGAGFAPGATRGRMPVSSKYTEEKNIRKVNRGVPEETKETLKIWPKKEKGLTCQLRIMTKNVQRIFDFCHRDKHDNRGRGNEKFRFCASTRLLSTARHP